jgi:hypothetical protein
VAIQFVLVYVCAQSTVDLATELQQTKFTNTACDPSTNSIVTTIQNGIVSQPQTVFQYSGICGNGGLLFNPPSATIAAGSSQIVNGTLFPQDGGQTIVGQLCTLQLTVSITTVSNDGATLTTQYVTNPLSFPCGDVQPVENCGWFALACYWTQGETTQSSFFWLLVCLLAIGVVFGAYFLIFRLAWESIESEKARKQLGHLEKRTAEEYDKGFVQVSRAIADDVKQDRMSLEDLDAEINDIESALSKPDAVNFMRHMENEQPPHTTSGQTGFFQNPTSWAFSFSANAPSQTLGTPAASKEDPWIPAFHAGGGERRRSSRRTSFDHSGVDGGVEMETMSHYHTHAGTRHNDGDVHDSLLPGPGPGPSSAKSHPGVFNSRYAKQ